MLRKEVIGETLDAHIGKWFNTDAAAEHRESLLRKLVAISLFMAPIETFVMHKKDIAMGEKKWSVLFLPIEPMNILNTVNYDSESPPSRYDSKLKKYPVTSRLKPARTCPQ